jgi:quinoprotein glucose dehydrogenase
MPAFPSLTDEQKDALADFLAGGINKELASTGPLPPAMKYHLTGYNRFLDPDGYPAVAPPWGTLNAINLNTGEYLWKIPFGEYPELAAASYAAPARKLWRPDCHRQRAAVYWRNQLRQKFHAYDISNGKLLWETTLPFAGNATPATYSVNGRQFGDRRR